MFYEQLLARESEGVEIRVEQRGVSSVHSGRGGGTVHSGLGVGVQDCAQVKPVYN